MVITYVEQTPTEFVGVFILVRNILTFLSIMLRNNNYKIKNSVDSWIQKYLKKDYIQ